VRARSLSPRTVTWRVAFCLLAGLSAWPQAAWGRESAQPTETQAVGPAQEKTAAEIAAAHAAEDRGRGLGDIPWLWWVAPIGGVFALYMGRKYYYEVLEREEGDPLMKEIAGYVREGAMAYLRRQYTVVAIVFGVMIVVLWFLANVLHVQHWLVPFAFLTGGFFSGLCGFLGMRTATVAAHRTTAGARRSLNDALQVAFRAGAVMGLVVVGFAVFDVTVWFLVLYLFMKQISLYEITVIMLTFGMGCAMQALFARVGGGIYTKAADVGADLVGKVEAGIPEDDPRNAATIADNVGDNVCDVAGMGADLYDSYTVSILASATLGVAAARDIATATGQPFLPIAMSLLCLPIIVAGLGIFASVFLGIKLVRTREGASQAELIAALKRGINGSSVGTLLAIFAVCYLLFKVPDFEGVHWWGIGLAATAGLLAGVAIGQFTEYYTSYAYSPTRYIAEQAITGPATVIIAGIAEGMKSTWAAIGVVVVAILASFSLAGGHEYFTLGLYGGAIGAVGMLSTLGMTLATDAYGPIADNAGGNAVMSHQAPEVRERTDALDSLGNTTAATGKGFSIASGALAALALLACYIEEVRIGQVREAKWYVEKHYPQARAEADAMVGRKFYMGYGKFATKEDPGTGETAYQTYLMVNRDRTVEGRRLEDLIALGAELPEPTPAQRKNDFVQTVALPVQDPQGRPLTIELELVSTKYATIGQFMRFYDVTVMNPRVLCGLFAGVFVVFLFCALTMKAVGRAANKMMLECRRQFDKLRAFVRLNNPQVDPNDPANWPARPIEFEGARYPDYANCVAISTAGAQREMIPPALLVILTPLLIGLFFDVPGVMGLLSGALACGFGVAIFMCNAGGAWDNAKKWIETGQHGGKGSEAHRAGVVGDTVGDPFKDTSGPSVNILLKMISLVSVVYAGITVKFAPMISAALGIQ
jgi:K(+)-stimulated pyrophosphate-energized sodium pump